MFKTLAKVLKYHAYRKDELPWGANLSIALNKIATPREFKVVFDVGANAGQSAMWMNREFRNAIIYSFEPVPATFRKLEKNVSSLERVRRVNLAVGEKDEQLDMEIDQTPGANKSSLVTDGSGDMISVSLCSLDGFSREESIRGVDFLKVDTEGWEIPVLTGASKLLEEKKVKFIFIEAAYNPNCTGQTYLGTLVDFLNSRGYSLIGLFDQEFNPSRIEKAFCNALFAVNSLSQ